VSKLLKAAVPEGTSRGGEPRRRGGDAAEGLPGGEEPRRGGRAGGEEPRRGGRAGGEEPRRRRRSHTQYAAAAQVPRDAAAGLAG